MAEQILDKVMLSPEVQVSLVSQLRLDYLNYQALFREQSALAQRFLEIQAAAMAEAVIQGQTQIRFSFPDKVKVINRNNTPETHELPAELREQAIGGLVDRLIHVDLRTALRSRLMELEQSGNPPVSTAAILIRYALVIHMIHNLLPAGKSVRYIAMDGDEIPSIPVADNNVVRSALTANSDAKTIEGENAFEKQGELQVPYVEAARRFFLPQWVAFDDKGKLLVTSVNEAEANIVSMQRYLSILHSAVGLAPFLVANEEYQQKRYGILGQLVNQGRALAHHEVKNIIATIIRRANAQELNRGLSLSLPYFNDQTLEIEKFDFDVIPAGRVMFVPAFVVLAVRAQGAKVVQDTRLSQSTRRHILMELSTLEETFLR